MNKGALCRWIQRRGVIDMQYLVDMRLAAAAHPTTAGEGRILAEQFILPTLARCEELASQNEDSCRLTGERHHCHCPHRRGRDRSGTRSSTHEAGGLAANGDGSDSADDF